LPSAYRMLRNPLREKNVHLKPFSVDELQLLPLVPFKGWREWLERHQRYWSADLVIFLNAQQREHFTGRDREMVAKRIHTDWLHYRNSDGRFFAFMACDFDPKSLQCLMTRGLTLDDMLKTILMQVTAKKKRTWCRRTHGKRLSDLLHAAELSGREAELVRDFDSFDLERVDSIAGDSFDLERVDSIAGCVPLRFGSCPAHCPSDLRASLRALAGALFRSGVSVRSISEQAKAKCGMQMFHIDKWCAWEERQWFLIMSTFGSRGLRLPDTVASLIASCIRGPEERNLEQVEHEDDALATLQEVHHSEPVPRINMEVAHSALQMDADEHWASSVKRQLQEHAGSHFAAELRPENMAEEGSERVFLLRVGGDNIEGLRQRLLTGPEFAPCRLALDAAGLSCELPEKALVFVQCWQYDATRRALIGKELHYFHIIIAESFEYLLDEALQKFPRRQRAKIKQQYREAIMIEPPMAEMPDLSCEPLRMIVARSFLCPAPLRMAASQVNQSTTEAVGDSPFHYSHSRGVNPRRAIAASISDS